MKFITASAAMLILATTAGLAQTVAPSTPRAFSHRTSGMAMTDAEGKAAAARSESLMQQRVDEMKATVAKMHVLLKQMQTTAVATHSKDPVAKANLQMWELMVGQFDKQLAELGQAARVREDMESRRQAMYKQAEQRAAEQALKARGATAAQIGTAGASSPSSATPATQESTSPTSPSSSSASPQ